MKKLLAIAVAVAFAAPAMADTNVYGKVHMSVGSTEDVDGIFVQSHSSRLGFKGSNALDNGLTATHQLEIGYNYVDGDAGLSARNSWIGLKGGFGEVRVGRQTTPYSAIDDAAAFPQRNDHALHTFDRVPNALAYINKFGPVGVAVAYVAAGEAEGGTGSDNVANITVNYKAGPLYAGVGHQSAPDTFGEDSTKVALAYTGANYAVGYVHEKNPEMSDSTSNTVSGKYTMGKVSLVGQYGKNKDGATDAEIDQKNIEIGYKLGKGTMAYYEWEDLADTTSNRVGLVHNF